MTNFFLVAFVALFGTAYSSCLNDYETNYAGLRTYCLYGCCGDYCCTVDTSNGYVGLTSGYIVLIVLAVVAKLIFWISCCFCCWRRRNMQTVVVMPPQQTSVSVSNSNPMHAGYDQTRAPASPPPYDDRKYSKGSV